MQAEYVDHMGSDLSVVNAARVSFDKVSEWTCKCGDLWWCGNDERGWACESCGSTERILSAEDTRLIHYLAPLDRDWETYSYVVPLRT